MSAKKLDYSKWDHIEISDDEDDTHPNIDTPSLFRWRHQARVERMEQAQKEKEDLQKSRGDHQQKLQQIKQKLKEVEPNKDADIQATEQLAKLKLEMEELQKQEDEFKRKEEELVKKEKLTPLNIDTICKEGKSKTLRGKESSIQDICKEGQGGSLNADKEGVMPNADKIINKLEPRKPENLTEEEKVERLQKFTAENEKLIKKFGMMRKYDDSQEFLLENPHLACEETANYLVIWCINLEVEEKSDLMNHVSHQTIVMQFILELAKSLELDPRGCIRAFFSRIKLAEKQYTDAFNDELESFKDRVRKRAQAKIEEATRQVEEEERQKRLGPGGLDPVEVFESLPDKMKECFEKKDIQLLQDVVAQMPKEEAELHIKRCIDSGLWVPNAKDLEKDKEDGGAEGKDEGSDNETYAEVA